MSKTSPFFPPYRDIYLFKRYQNTRRSATNKRGRQFPTGTHTKHLDTGARGTVGWVVPPASSPLTNAVLIKIAHIIVKTAHSLFGRCRRNAVYMPNNQRGGRGGTSWRKHTFVKQARRKRRGVTLTKNRNAAGPRPPVTFRCTETHRSTHRVMHAENTSVRYSGQHRMCTALAWVSQLLYIGFCCFLPLNALLLLLLSFRECGGSRSYAEVVGRALKERTEDVRLGE